MNTVLMNEWLLMFYLLVRDRHVILLMDNFRAHQCALKETPPPDSATVIYLPGRSPSIYQAREQGIIYNSKVHFIKKLLQSQLRVLYLNRMLICDGNLPAQLVKLAKLQAVLLFCEAWYDDVKTDTIINCFSASTLFAASTIENATIVAVPPPQASKPSPPDAETSELYKTFVKASNVLKGMDIRKFLKPDGEDIPPITAIPTIDSLVADCTAGQEAEAGAEEGNSAADLAPRVPCSRIASTISELLVALEAYEEYTPEMKDAHDKMFELFYRKAMAAKVQPSIYSFRSETSQNESTVSP